MKPRILLYDIETRPNLAYVWGKYEQNVLAYKEEWSILSVAWKWLGEKEVNYLGREKSLNSDKKVTKKIHSLFNQADIVIAHNGDRFDQRKSRARMIANLLPPTKTLTTIDTLKVAKAHFAFNGNGLNDLAEHLGLGKKVKVPGFDLWEGCMRGDAKSWKLMERYNKRDVVLLERVYKRFRPWIVNHPHLGRLLRVASVSCPACGNSRPVKWGIRICTSQVRQRWCCNSCGHQFTTAKGANK